MEMIHLFGYMNFLKICDKYDILISATCYSIFKWYDKNKIPESSKYLHTCTNIYTRRDKRWIIVMIRTLHVFESTFEYIKTNQQWAFIYRPSPQFVWLHLYPYATNLFCLPSLKLEICSPITTYYEFW